MCEACGALSRTYFTGVRRARQFADKDVSFMGQAGFLPKRLTVFLWDLAGFSARSTFSRNANSVLLRGFSCGCFSGIFLRVFAEALRAMRGEVPRFQPALSRGKGRERDYFAKRLFLEVRANRLVMLS